eukprot:EG_transcript_8613
MVPKTPLPGNLHPPVSIIFVILNIGIGEELGMKAKETAKVLPWEIVLLRKPSPPRPNFKAGTPVVDRRLSKMLRRQGDTVTRVRFCLGTICWFWSQNWRFQGAGV